MAFDPDRPLAVGEAKKLIAAILADDEGDGVSFTGHAFRELKKDNMTTVDAVNILRRGVVREAEWENGTLRYRVQTQKMTVVVHIRSKTSLVVVTAWRNKR